MEKRALLAAFLSFLVLFLYQYYMLKYQQKKRPSKKVTEKMEKGEARETLPQKISFSKTKPIGKKIRAGKDIVVDTDSLRLVFDSKNGTLKSCLLKKYKKSLRKDSGLVDLVSVASSNLMPLYISFSNKKDFVATNFFLKETKDGKKVLTLSSSLVSKVFVIPKSGYLIRCDLISHTKALLKNPTIFWVCTEKNHYSRFSYRGVSVCFDDGRVERFKMKKIKKYPLSFSDVRWTAFENKYFIASFIRKEGGCEQRAEFLNDNLILSMTYPKDTKVATYLIYLGPKDYDILKSIGYKLSSVIDFGWFDPIAKPLLLIMKWFYKYIPNYGIVIIILTILIKIVFIPLQHKSIESMKQMQKLQPEIERLRKLYKDDKERLNRAIMDLYRQYKVNPFGGCLPVVIQIPVFFALYKVLLYSIELRHAPFMFWIKDLSSKDPYYVTPILMGISMFFQQKITPSVGDPKQAKMMLFLPVVFTIMFLNFPSGLVLYWFVNNLLSIAQQLYENRKIS